jgi:hypothetical protein
MNLNLTDDQLQLVIDACAFWRMHCEQLGTPTAEDLAEVIELLEAALPSPN